MRRKTGAESVLEDHHAAQGSGREPGACVGPSFVCVLLAEACSSPARAQAMLYATEGINSDADFNKAMVGVASVW